MLSNDESGQQQAQFPQELSLEDNIMLLNKEINIDNFLIPQNCKEYRKTEIKRVEKQRLKDL